MVELEVTDPRHPICLLPSDNLGNVIISIQLGGSDNYSIWSRAMKIALRAKRKSGFIDGTCKKSSYKDDLAEEWERVNATVLTWIMNTISKELVNGIVYADNAHAVWMDLQEQFDKVNGSRIYNLHREIATISQGTSDISTYHSRLHLLWDEYCSLVPAVCGCVASKDFKLHLEQQKLFQFMMGLNESYSAIRSQILLMMPSPSVSQAHAMLVHEESQRKICESSSCVGNELNESTTLMSIHEAQSRGRKFNNSNNYGNNYGGNSSYNNNSFCEICKRKGHHECNCYRVIGYLPGYRGKKKLPIKLNHNAMGENNWDRPSRQANMTVHDYVSDKEDIIQHKGTSGGSSNGSHSVCKYQSYHQRANFTQHAGNSCGGNVQRSQCHSRAEPDGSKGQNYFTDEQYNQIMNMLDKGKGVELAGSMAGAMYWESERDW